MLLRAVICALLLLVSPGSRLASARPGPTPTSPDQGVFWRHLENLRFGPVTLDVGGQVRLRFEAGESVTIKGYAPEVHDQLLLERLRLDVSARFGGQRRLFLQLQDAHALLTRFVDRDFPRSSPLADTFDVRQLYGEWSHISGSPIGIRVGRQQISYGDQRVFGPGSWGNTGRYAWDAAMLRFETDRLASDTWVGRPLTYRSSVWPNRAVDDFLTFVNYTQFRKLPARVDIFYVLKHDTSGQVAGESGAGDLSSHTVGLQVEGHPFARYVDASGTVAWQWGRHGRDTLRASGASGKLGLTTSTAWRPYIGVQYTWGSGDSNPTDGVHGTFDGVYGGRDIFFYGYLNLFFWANLRDAEIDLRVMPHRSFTAFLEFHHLSLDRPTDAWYTTSLSPYRRDPTGLAGADLGTELDIRAVWALSARLELLVGAGRFFPGRFVERTGPAPRAHWYCAQATYSW